MNKKQETRITIRFPSHVIEDLKPLAKSDNRSLNAEIVQAVQEYIARKKESKK